MPPARAPPRGTGPSRARPKRPEFLGTLIHMHKAATTKTSEEPSLLGGFFLSLCLLGSAQALAADPPNTANAPATVADDPTPREIPGAELRYKKAPLPQYPSTNKTDTEVECYTTATWNAEGKLLHAYTPVGPKCPLTFARASSAGFTTSTIHPMEPPAIVQSRVRVRMILHGDGDESSVVEDIFHVTQPLDVTADHCVLVVGIARAGGVYDLASNDRTQCAFEPSVGVMVPRRVWKTLASEVVCELTATAAQWELGEPTFTDCPEAVRGEASRLLSEWAVVQSPPPRDHYEITLLFQGPQ